MTGRKLSIFLSAMTVGVVAVFIISIGLLGLTPARAQEQGVTDSARQTTPAQQAQTIYRVTVDFTPSTSVSIMDRMGNVISEVGTHGGQLRCNDNNCNQKTQVIVDPSATDPVVYEYRFMTRQVFDPVQQTVIVAGTGTVSSGGAKERFSFTATFADNRDNETISVIYDASRPDASFIILKSPGTFSIDFR